MGTMLTLLTLGALAFGIFFVFKQIQFFIQSVDLYKEMIAQQKTMISLLRNITMTDKEETSRHTPLPATVTEIAPSAITNNTRECPKCHKKYDDNAIECPECFLELIY